MIFEEKYTFFGSMELTDFSTVNWAACSKLEMLNFCCKNVSVWLGRVVFRWAIGKNSSLGVCVLCAWWDTKCCALWNIQLIRAPPPPTTSVNFLLDDRVWSRDPVRFKHVVFTCISIICSQIKYVQGWVFSFTNNYNLRDLVSKFARTIPVHPVEYLTEISEIDTFL